MPAMRDLLDVVVIGAGHNGLTCACYLAAAGLKVHVVERRSVVGGAAVTEEFHPGFRNSTASYTVSLLNPKVIRDLRLAEHGLRIVERPFSNFVPLAAGQSLRFGGDLAMTQTEVARFSKRDAERLPRTSRASIASRTSSSSGCCSRHRISVDRLSSTAGATAVAGAKLLLQFGRLPREGQRDLVDMFTKSAGRLARQLVRVGAAEGACSAGTPSSATTPARMPPGSAYVLLHHCFGEVNGKAGKWGHAMGGMGAITQAMAAEARARGVEIERRCTGGPRSRRERRGGRRRADDGEEIRARGPSRRTSIRSCFIND